ncbi:ABC-F family ATP-binding cassette domain-containing protein [Rhizobium leguminosarum]|uniref:ABC-F family ATP-binding cassette domain-containing protein n=1 Tax=Rhizobium leguminosarum TaxID=384 RepID=A0A444I7A7_RHILE|nr:ABC-F family ATP-binding cassette domain-containing protein [Rhizobium leguminosarum]RWX34197.1 ABC-F family ATP-binding cassette domain-containing protein [Rhizobium leguminosarum]
MCSITVSRLSWSRPDSVSVFANLDLSFSEERAGLVGRNGVGKTTFLKLIAGRLQPSAGTVSVQGRVAIVKQEIETGTHETIADLFDASEAIAVLRRAESGEASIEELTEADWTAEQRIADALARVGLDAQPNTLLASLSGGQRTRAALAAAISSEPDFLLLDEPTNNLDRDGRRAVIGLLAKWQGGAIVVSHDRELLEHVDAIVELTSFGARRYRGNWSSYRTVKAAELDAAEQELAHARKTVDEINRKAQLVAERRDRRDAAGARKGARGDLPRLLLGQRKSNAEASKGQGVKILERQRGQALDAVVAAKARVEILHPLSVRLPRTGLPAGRPVLALDHVTASYASVLPIIRNFSFSVTGPERVAVIGSNGSGKTTLLKLIAGAISPSNGTVSVSVPFAMLDQSLAMLERDATVLENFMRINPGTTENACRASLAAFAFRADAAIQQVGALSGGQTLRAGLACVLGGLKPPSLLILDEPTNHLDVDSIAAVEHGLLAYDGALLVVSHDETFLANINVGRWLQLGSG